MDLSAENRNDFKQIQLPDGTIIKPVGMELKQIRIFKYKQFESPEEGYVFDLSQSLTTLVGPNSSGKTTLLEILRIFCVAVKHGTKCYSLEDAQLLFEIKKQYFFQGLHGRLQGTFDVHYGNENEIIKALSLRLNVSLIKASDCEDIDYNENPTDDNNDDNQIKNEDENDTTYEDEHGITGEDKNDSTDEHETTEPTRVHVIVAMHYKDKAPDLWAEMEKKCPERSKNVFLYRSNYGKLDDLFPRIVSFTSKTVENDDLRSLYGQYPNINDHEEELSEEIRRIFPYVELSKCFDGACLANKNKQDQHDEKLDTKIPYILSVGTCWRSSARNYDLTMLYGVASVGEGVLQCLYIIITVCCAKRNSVILIDEPDAHVFAPAQKQLIDFFYRKLEAYRKSNSFCQMVITTHSPEIMQAVELKDVRQIFVDSKERTIISIRSLECGDQLANIMTDIGTSILTHSELVYLSQYRKILFLEGADDYNFLYGIIRKFKSELLTLPFTQIHNHGRSTPSEIRQLILSLQQLFPENSKLHLFILVDADLRHQTVLDNEAKDYTMINEDKKLNVKITYHCWEAREWENWLLSNENLLYEMLCDNNICHNNESIKNLRSQIRQHQPTNPIFSICDSSQYDQSMTTENCASSNPTHHARDKCLFKEWFKKELERHFKHLLTNLTKSNMEGIKNISTENEQKLQREAWAKFSADYGIDANVMSKFGSYSEQIQGYMGRELRKQSEEYKKEKEERKKQQKYAGERKKQQIGNESDQRDAAEQKKRQQKGNASEADPCGDWLRRRGLEQINMDDLDTRKNLVKWIDAKLFFHQLTHGESSKPKNIDLDNYWKQAFAMGNSKNPYERYFNSLDSKNSDEWPDNFNTLLEKFEKFVKGL